MTQKTKNALPPAAIQQLIRNLFDAVPVRQRVACKSKAVRDWAARQIATMPKGSTERGLLEDIEERAAKLLRQTRDPKKTDFALWEQFGGVGLHSETLLSWTHYYITEEIHIADDRMGDLEASALRCALDEALLTEPPGTFEGVRAALTIEADEIQQSRGEEKRPLDLRELDDLDEVEIQTPVLDASMSNLTLREALMPAAVALVAAGTAVALILLVDRSLWHMTGAAATLAVFAGAVAKGCHWWFRYSPVVTIAQKTVR